MFVMCEAFDPDSKEYSTNVNQYKITSIIGCQDSECQESIESLPVEGKRLCEYELKTNYNSRRGCSLQY